MGALRRWLVRLTETDEARLDAEIREWAEAVPGSVRIGDAPLRQPVKIAGDPSTSNLADFERRRAQGRGRFLTAADLDKKQNRSLVAVLANAFGGLMSTPDPARPGHNILMTRGTKPRLTNVDVHCGIDVYLDNSQYLDDLEALHPSDLAGVEYYPIESAPGEYRKLTDNCGVLVLWSRK